MSKPIQVAIMQQDPRLNQPICDALEGDGVPLGQFVNRQDLMTADSKDLSSVEVLLAPGHMRIDDEVLARLPNLRSVVSSYMGIEGFDRAAATARGILIGNGQMEESVESMAEGTILMLLAAAYQLPACTAAMADGAWPVPIARGRLLRAMTIGIIGYGQTAQAVVSRLEAFGCRIMVHAPRIRAPLPPAVEQVTLTELIKISDAIIMLASLGPENHHLVNAAMIAQMKQGAIVVNTARGALIDENALAAASLSGSLGWLALDVFEKEPLPASASVRSLDNAILTPHCIGHSVDTITRLPFHVIESIRSVLNGGPPRSLVNPDAISKWRAKWNIA